MPVLKEGEICMGEQVSSTNSETQIFDVNLRNVSGDATGCQNSYLLGRGSIRGIDMEPALLS